MPSYDTDERVESIARDLIAKYHPHLLDNGAKFRAILTRHGFWKDDVQKFCEVAEPILKTTPRTGALPFEQEIDPTAITASINYEEA